MTTLEIKRLFVIVSAVYQLVLAIAIYNRKDIKERWLMPMLLFNAIHTIVLYVFIMWGVLLPRTINTWSTFLRMQTNASNTFLLFTIASGGKFIWKSQ